jgi:ornithine cyclodeaminase/alanine dehydrogenase-like protein (mu-crystallin family)
MQIYDAAATRAALPFERLIAALHERFVAGAEVPARHAHDIVNPGGDAPQRRMTSLVMPAWIPGRYYGVKVVNIAPGNAAHGLPGLHAAYLLFDANTGVTLAQIDGDEITARRTAAASALAGCYLAREDARYLLVVGGGRVASVLPAAWRAVRPIEHVMVWTRRPEQAQALVARLRAEGFEAAVHTDLASACRKADIVSCATLATEPLIHGGWLAPGTHLDLIGSFMPTMREADDACLEDARLFVDTEEALTKSGDLVQPIQQGKLRPDRVRGTLRTLCNGMATGRRHRDERTVFKSVGHALEDLAAAMLVYETGRASA